MIGAGVIHTVELDPLMELPLWLIALAGIVSIAYIIYLIVTMKGE